MTHATEYLETMITEASALDRLLSFDSWNWADRSEALETLGEDAHELARELSHYGEDGEPVDWFAAWLEAVALEVTLTGKRTLGETDWTVDSVRVLRTYGGPTAYVETAGTDYVRVVVLWTERVERTLHAPQLSARLEELEEFAA